MTKISGCYRWNDTLALSDKGFLLECAITANGMRYTEAMIVPSEDNSLMIALFDEAEEMALIYFSECGWIGAVSIYEENPIIAMNDLWQTWDFGEGQEVDDDFYAYLTANASRVSSAEAVCLSYDGKIIASLDGGQRATFHCQGKSMNSDLLLLVPKKKISASGGTSSMNVAFGNTAPEDTGKLWIKTAEPESVAVKLDFEFAGNEQLHSATLSMPTSVYYSAAAAMGKKIYIFGGGQSASDMILIYDTEANTVQRLSETLPYKVHALSAATVGSKIYLFGGNGESETFNKIWIFDPATNTLESPGVNMPDKLYLSATAVVGKKIFLFGGAYRGSSSVQCKRNIYMFNTESNSIAKLGTSFSVDLYGATAAAVGTKIYIFGGYKNPTFYDSIYRFDTESYTLTALETVLPNPVYLALSAAIGSTIYVFGGSRSSGGGLNTILRFNTLTETLETIDTTLAKNIYGTPCVAIGSKIFVFDGVGAASDGPLVNTFIVNIDLPENHLLIEAGGSGHMMNLFPNLEIGVKNVFLGNAEGKGERVPAAVYRDGAWEEI